MRFLATSRADELEHGHADDPIGEGISRTEDAVLRGVTRDAQLWLSAIFVLVRRRRPAGNGTPTATRG